MGVPNNLRYSKEHEWVRVEGEFAIVGITEFAQGELGDIIFVDIDTVGETLNENDIFGSVEAVKTVSDLFMPIGGEIIELNEKLTDAPELVNTDPYGEGWMIKVKISDSAELDSLLDAQSYDNFIN